MEVNFKLNFEDIKKLRGWVLGALKLFWDPVSERTSLIHPRGSWGSGSPTKDEFDKNARVAQRVLFSTSTIPFRNGVENFELRSSQF